MCQQIREGVIKFKGFDLIIKIFENKREFEIDFKRIIE